MKAPKTSPRNLALLESQAELLIKRLEENPMIDRVEVKWSSEMLQLHESFKNQNKNKVSVNLTKEVDNGRSREKPIRSV